MKTVAIMQPYFLPYLGYFSLIYHSEHFIFFDTPQYTKKSWYERNRIIKLTGGSTYIKVPIKKVNIGTPINLIEINNDINWQQRLLGQLSIYKNAPNYCKIIELVSRILIQNHKKLYTLNIALIKEILEYLGIQRKISIFSQMDLIIDDVKEPDEWALNICKSIGATTYINSPGGKSFFNPEKYKRHNISLKFLDQPTYEYKQLIYNFESGLSILDLLMHLDKVEILKRLNKASLN